MRTEPAAERDPGREDRLDAFRDRLEASHEKQGRLYARLLDARDRIARLEGESRQLHECLSEAREHNAALMEENRLLRQQPAGAAPRPRVTERSRLLLGIGVAAARREAAGEHREPVARP